MNRTLGMVLIALGVVLLLWTGFTYTKKEKIIDMGPVQVSADKEKSVNWPPYAGAIVLVIGIVVLLNGPKRNL